MGLLDIPPELVLFICEFCHTADRSHFSMVSKSFDGLLTPTLYKTIHFDSSNNWERMPADNRRTRAFICCKTLVESPRNLAGLVESFLFDDINLVTAEYAEGLVSGALSRMDNLKHYRCTGPWGFTPAVCAALVKLPTLQSITVALSFDEELECPPTPMLKITPKFPSLTAFHFTCRLRQRIPRPYQKFIRHLLIDHAPQIIHLSLVSTRSANRALSPLLDMDVQFPVLESFAIDTPSISHTLPRQMPNLQCLIIPYDREAQFRRLIEGMREKVSFPSVTTLICTWYRFQRFVELCTLPNARSLYLDHVPNPCLQAKIHTKGLAKWENVQSPQRLSFTQLYQIYPKWPDVVSFTSAVPVLNSAKDGVVSTLAFSVSSISFKWLPDIVPFLIHLSSLSISFITYSGRLDDELSELGERFFACMPSLHTFRLNYGLDVYSLVAGKLQNTNFQSFLLSDWENHSRSLRYVTFASSDWELINDAWIQVSH